MSHVSQYLIETATIVGLLDQQEIEDVAAGLISLRNRNGRLFMIGLGGSAANCSHAVNDFRKLCGIEAYSPVDNVAELTARANDEGWEGIFSRWLDGSNASENDALFVLSVGGGSDKVSLPLKLALNLAQSRKMAIFGIVGRDGGYTKELGHYVVLVPPVKSERITPHTEGFQSVILHCLVSHPELQKNKTVW